MLYNTFNEFGERVYSKNDIYKKFNIDDKTLNNWLKNEEELRNIHAPKNKKTIHPGKASSVPKEEKEIIINFVENNIPNFIPLNYHLAVEKIIAMKLNILTGISYKAKYKRIVRFLKSHYYTIRKTTHIEQTIRLDATDKALYFLKTIIQRRKLFNYNLSFLINCDESPIRFYSLLSCRLSKIGKKAITIKTMGKEKD